MGRKIFGRGKVTIDGVLYDTKKGITFDPGGTKRTPNPGSHTTDGYTEEDEGSKLGADILVDASFSLDAIKSITNGVMQVELDTGQTWIVNGAYSGDRPTINESDGTCKIDMLGPEAIEVA